MTSRQFSAFEQAFYFRFQMLPQSEDDRKSMPMIYFQQQVKAKRDLRRAEQLLAAQLIQRWFRGARVRKSTPQKQPVVCLRRVQFYSDASSLKFCTVEAPSRCCIANSTVNQFVFETTPSGSNTRKPLNDDTVNRHHPWSTSTSPNTKRDFIPYYEPATVMKCMHQKENTPFSERFPQSSCSSTETSFYTAESRLDQSAPSSIVKPMEVRQAPETPSIAYHFLNSVTCPGSHDSPAPQQSI